MMITVNDHIIGGPQVDDYILDLWLFHRNPKLLREPVRAIVSVYTAFGQLSRIGNLIPFAQAIHETATFTSARWTQSYNPAGLGSTDDKTWGSHFANPAEGIAAHYAHLLAYASKLEELSYAQRLLLAYDPRLEALTKAWGRGCAPTWGLLNGKWAVPGTTYAQSVVAIANQILKG